MASIAAVLIALFVAIAIAVVVLLIDRLLSGPPRPVQATPPAQPPRAPTPTPPSAMPTQEPAPTRSRANEQDEEITIVGFAPIMLDDTAQEDWADSDVVTEEELGKTHKIVHDASAIDDEPTASQPLILVSAVGQTHRGQRRSNNQDSFAVLNAHNVFVVADGMGGYAGGEIASQLAVDTLTKAFDENVFAGNYPHDLHRDGAQLAAAIQMCNRAVWNHAQEHPELEGMGTTLVAARFSPRRERIYVGHVGDSRCYRFRDGVLEAITQDHNLAQMGVQGRNGHMLTRAVGIAVGVEVDLILARPSPGDRYLLCSDGLNKMVPDEQIVAVLSRQGTAEEIVETLVSMANEAGGKDNITVILVQVTPP